MINNKYLIQPYAAYTGEELAQIFAINPNEYKQDFKDGKLKGQRCGKKYRFVGEQLKDYLENHRGIQAAYLRETTTQRETPIDIDKAQSERLKASKRTTIRLRWKMLVRDNFTCQYCDRKAPEVTLKIDHKRP